MSELLPPPPVRHRRAVSATLLVGVVLVGLVVLTALLSFVWTPHDPGLVGAGPRLTGPSADHLLGTDRLGRDELSRLMVGARTTLLVGIVAVGIATLVGVPYGIASAMAPRPLDGLLVRAGDLALAFPALLLAIMLSAVLGGSTTVAMIAIGLASVPAFARVARASTAQVLSQEYVLAARASGRGALGIARHHVLPNISAMVLVQASVSFAMAILAEAALSFLGLGTPPDVPSWGRMLQESQDTLWTTTRLAWVPGGAIAAAVLGFNLLGDGLRDLLDPTLEDRS